MFQYEQYRHKSTDDNFVEDIFDSATYSKFKTLIPVGGQLIFLQVCWDGADMFNYSGKSMWPLCYSIMNFPPSLRDKPHIGMHMAAFDDGSLASLEMLAEEALDLWLNPIQLNGVLHYVVIGQLLIDGKGRESACHVQGATSLAGCNICHFEGRTFANRRVFDGIRRYSTMQDSCRRMDSRKNNRLNYQFSFNERRERPRKRTYDDYVSYAKTAGK